MAINRVLADNLSQTKDESPYSRQASGWIVCCWLSDGKIIPADRSPQTHSEAATPLIGKDRVFLAVSKSGSSGTPCLTKQHVIESA
jgi:hypothetical protein